MEFSDVVPLPRECRLGAVVPPDDLQLPQLPEAHVHVTIPLPALHRQGVRPAARHVSGLRRVEGQREGDPAAARRVVDAHLLDRPFAVLLAFPAAIDVAYSYAGTLMRRKETDYSVMAPSSSASEYHIITSPHAMLLTLPLAGD